MARVQWKLREFLDKEGISAYRLAEETRGALSRTGIYRLTRDDLAGIRFESLQAIVPALRKLTGKPVNVQDLLEVVESPPEGISAAGVRYTGDPETDEVLDDHPDILERIKRLERGETKLIPLEQVIAEENARRGLG